MSRIITELPFSVIISYTSLKLWHDDIVNFIKNNGISIILPSDNPTDVSIGLAIDAVVSPMHAVHEVEPKTMVFMIKVKNLKSEASLEELSEFRSTCEGYFNGDTRLTAASRWDMIRYFKTFDQTQSIPE
jgi:hypothetical protein